MLEPDGRDLKKRFAVDTGSRAQLSARGIVTRVLLTAALVASTSYLTGCAPSSASSYVQLNPPLPTMKSRPPTSVEIFSTPHLQRPYIEVGILGVQGLANVAGSPSWDDLIRTLRAQAGVMGCDALYLIGRVDNFIQGTCLAYTDSPHP